MNYDFDKAINKILDKVFKSTASAGYDADEVDAFFDEIIDYIRGVRELQKTLWVQLENKDKEIAKLKLKIQQIEAEAKKTEERLKDLEAEGYSNYKNYKGNK